MKHMIEYYVAQSQTGTGGTIAQTTPGVFRHSAMERQPGRVYQIRRLIWRTFFNAAGAGYSYLWSWRLGRAVTPTATPVWIETNPADDYIFHHRMRDGDSYVQYAHVERYSESIANSIEWDKNDAPIVALAPVLHHLLYLNYDSVGGRSWNMMMMLSMYFDNKDVSPKEYERLSRVYGLRGI